MTRRTAPRRTTGDADLDELLEERQGGRSWERVAADRQIDPNRLRKQVYRVLRKLDPSRRARWVRSTTPLTDSEYLALRAYLVRELGGGALDRGVAYTAWVVWTGAHPVVLSDPNRFNLRLDGETSISWTRPKTGRFVLVPLVPELKSRASELLSLFRSRTATTRRIGQLVAETGRRAGIEGLSPRGLRHTYISRVVRSTGNIYQAAQLGGTSPQIALTYANYLDPSAVAKIAREGL